MKQSVFNNASIVLDDEVIKGSIVVENGKFIDIDHSPSQIPSAEDWQGDYLIPGLIELHTDNMEKYFSPRPGVNWPGVSAIMAHDTQMSASGVTTVFDAVAVGYDIYKSNRTEILKDIIESINYITDHSLSRTEHFLHLRCELSCEATSAEFEQYAKNPLLRLVSLMDHSPGQRQFSRIDKYKQYYQTKYGFSDADMGQYIAQHQQASEIWSNSHRQYIAEYCRVLKPGRWMTVVFHNSRNAVWNAIQEAMQAAGFVVADVEPRARRIERT